jgi:MFS family permease
MISSRARETQKARESPMATVTKKSIIPCVPVSSTLRLTSPRRIRVSSPFTAPDPPARQCACRRCSWKSPGASRRAAAISPNRPPGLMAAGSATAARTTAGTAGSPRRPPIRCRHRGPGSRSPGSAPWPWQPAGRAQIPASNSPRAGSGSMPRTRPSRAVQALVRHLFLIVASRGIAVWHTSPVVLARVTGGVFQYRRILGHRAAIVPFAAATGARLPVSMAPLGIIVLIAAERDSYGIAGTIAGFFTLFVAIGCPVWGRAMDRGGQPRTLLMTSLTSGLLLACLVGATRIDWAWPVLAVIAAAAGFTFPPISPAMRAAWKVVFPSDEDLRRRCYALDAVAVDLIFVLGPLLLSLTLVWSPAAPLLVAAVLLFFCGGWFSRTPAIKRNGAVTDTAARWTSDRPRLRRSNDIWLALAVSGGVAIAFGMVDTSFVAIGSGSEADAADLGLLFAAIAGGSILGGLAYGALDSSSQEEPKLALMLLVYAVPIGLTAPSLLIDGPYLLVLLPMLFVAGLAISPSLIVLQGIVERAAPDGRHNEAQSWLSTSNVCGAALGTALAGFLVDAIQVQYTLVIAALVGVGVALAAAARWGWTPLVSRILPVSRIRSSISVAPWRTETANCRGNGRIPRPVKERVSGQSGSAPAAPAA